MKKELSALDIHHLGAEMKDLVGGRVDKIFYSGDSLAVQVYVTGKGNKFLTFLLPGIMYISEEKGKFPAADKLTMALRKYLSGARVREARQVGFERIVELVFEGKEGVYVLIIELFGKGNFILCKDDYTIVVAQKYKKFSQRTIRGGIKYELPDQKLNLKELFLDDIQEAIKTSNKESIVKTLAIVLGMGGVYAEEACLLAGISKDKASVSPKEIETLHTKIKLLVTRNLEPTLYPGKDVTPFPLEVYAGSDAISYESFSKAIYEYAKVAAAKPVEKSQSERERQNLIARITKQEEDILSLEEEAAEHQAKGERLYEQYTVVKDILESLQKAREKYSWKEIKEKLKGHPVVKEVNEADGKVVVEL